MVYGAIAVITLYYMAFLLYYRKLYPPTARRYIPAFGCLSVIAAIYGVAGQSYGHYWAIYLTVSLVLILMFRFSTAMNTLQAVYGSGMCTISAYCFRGIITGTYLLFFRRGEPGILKNPDIYYNITMIALPVALLYFVLIHRTILPDQRLKRVLSNPEQVGPIVGYQIIASIFLMILNQGRSISPDTQWYIKIALGACVLSLGMLIHAVFRAGEFMETQEYKWRSKMLEIQYDAQLRHYQVLEKFTDDLRSFRHDFRSTMSVLDTLIDSGESEKARKLIEEMQAAVQKMVRERQQFSDHVVLDAMLQDLAATCEEEHIRYSFHAVAPVHTNLSLLDTIRIFHNLTDNAVEACRKMAAEERFIEISAANTNGWTTLHILNSYNGVLKREGNKIISTKHEKENHGIGIASVEAIVEKLGGFVQFKVIKEKGLFSVQVNIPNKNEE